MKKGKLCSLIILGLFLTAFLSAVVIAQESIATQTRGLFANLGDIQLGQETRTGIAKVLFMALIAMIIYSIAEALPFIGKNDTVRWGISIVVAILAFLFVPMADIQGLLTTYEALGIVLTSIVPLVILFVFSVQFEEKMEKNHHARGAAVAQMLNSFLFIGFLVYLIGKTLFYVPTATGGILGWFYPVTILLTVIWWWKGKDYLMKQLTVKGEKAMAKNAGKRVMRAIFGLEELEKFHKGAAGEKVLPEPGE